MDEVRGGPAQRGTPCVTVDGSLVTALLRPERGGSRRVSVAEAVIQPGERTRLHRHAESDEIYYVLEGKGVLTLGEKLYSLKARSCVFLPAGSVHAVRCDGDEALRILCICAPPYTHEQTTCCK